MALNHAPVYNFDIIYQWGRLSSYEKSRKCGNFQITLLCALFFGLLFPRLTSFSPSHSAFLRLLFRCVRQERISMRGSVRRSVGPLVRQSVCLSVTPVQKSCFSAFWPWWDPILNQMIDKHILRALFPILSLHLSFCSIASPYMKVGQHYHSTLLYLRMKAFGVLTGV